MKKIITLLLVLVSTQFFSQTDRNGNPVFNSISTNEETINDFKLISNYYTLKNNIENKGSSVYVSDNPTLDQIESRATILPSDFFLIIKNQTLLNMVMILSKPSRIYFVLNPATKKQERFPCLISGDITENRANEIIKEKYDPKAKIEGNKLYFNTKVLTIISNKEIKEAILNLIETQKLSIGENHN